VTVNTVKVCPTGNGRRILDTIDAGSRDSEITSTLLAFKPFGFAVVWQVPPPCRNAKSDPTRPRIRLVVGQFFPLIPRTLI